jgi:rfaE bifunctional protein nucleotidyltransferase chain/domain
VNKIINVKKSESLSKKLRAEGKSIVITGGCFDILHVGHIKFLENAKKHGDYQFILLESDETVKRLKGNGRPINTQKDRAIILSALSCVDFVVLLSEIKSNSDYDKLIEQINPNFIATTKNDPQVIHNIRQAKKINAKVVYVTDRIKNKSTTNLAKIIQKQFEK